MADYYISPTGDNGTGDGSSGNPWQTMYYAETQVSSGDTVYLQDGTYSETQQISTSKSIDWIAVNELEAIVEVNLTGSENSWYERLDAGSEGVRTDFEGLLLKCIGSAGFSSAFIRNLNGNRQIGVNKCLVYKSGTKVGNGLASTSSYTACAGQAYNSTFRNWDRAIQGNNRSDNSFNARNNIFEGNNTAIYFSSGWNLTEDYNCFYNNTTNRSVGSIGSNSITSNPLFDGASLYITVVSSPCVDSGVIISPYTDGYAGSAPDMGCYEYPPGKVEGYVKLDDVGVIGAIVRAIEQDTGLGMGSTTTDGTGFFSLTGNFDLAKKYHVCVEYTVPGSGGLPYNAKSQWDITPVSN